MTTLVEQIHISLSTVAGVQVRILADLCSVPVV